MLTASHNHSGPALQNMLRDCYPLDDRQRALIEEYSDFLTETILETIAEALADRKPATLWAGQGTAGFAVNRRTNRERDLPKLLKRGERPNGPSDYTVPVPGGSRPRRRASGGGLRLRRAYLGAEQERVPVLGRLRRLPRNSRWRKVIRGARRCSSRAVAAIRAPPRVARSNVAASWARNWPTACDKFSTSRADRSIPV